MTASRHEPASLLGCSRKGFGEPAVDGPAVVSGGSVVAEWRENLAIMAANRTRDDERVMQRLGDRLWDERQEVRPFAGSTVGL